MVPTQELTSLLRLTYQSGLLPFPLLPSTFTSVADDCRGTVMCLGARFDSGTANCGPLKSGVEYKKISLLDFEWIRKLTCA